VVSQISFAAEATAVVETLVAADRLVAPIMCVLRGENADVVMVLLGATAVAAILRTMILEERHITCMF